MSGFSDHLPARLAVRLLRLEYWFDRLNEPQRLLVGLGMIVFLFTSLLYVLGIGSMIAVSRTDFSTDVPVTIVVATVPPRAEPPPTAVPGEPTLPPTPQPTPAVDLAGNLIAPPDVPEVPIIPPPPRAYIPQPQVQQQPIKPRVVASTPTPARVLPAATAAVPAVATKPATGAPQAPAPTRNPSQPNVQPTQQAPVRTQAPFATPVPTRPPVNTPAAPSIAPTAAPKPTTRPPTPAPKPR